MTTSATPLIPPASSVIGLSTPLIQTPFLQAGYLTATATMNGNNIAVLGGVPGTGKTTCARHVAQHADRACAVVTLPDRPAPLDMLRYISHQVTGHAPSKRATRYEMQEVLREVLPTWHGVLIIDEMQNSEARSMAELVYLYEETDHAFALIMVGTTVLTSITKYPQLSSRVMGRVLFGPLTGQTLLAAVRSLDPRLAASNATVLADHDTRNCHGILRRWIMTINWMNSLNCPPGRAVTDSTFRQIGALL